MTNASLRRMAYATVTLLAVQGAVFSTIATWGVAPASSAIAVLRTVAPALVVIAVVRMARDSRGALWAALIGCVLTLALGAALYAAALQGTRPRAESLAISLVPLRQLVAVACTAWAVWITRQPSRSR